MAEAWFGFVVCKVIQLTNNGEECTEKGKEMMEKERVACAENKR